MDLSEAIQDIQRTRRSQTFVFACRGRQLVEKLEWLKTIYGNKTMKEFEGR